MSDFWCRVLSRIALSCIALWALDVLLHVALAIYDVASK